MMITETWVSFCTIGSPIGRLTLTADGAALTGVYMASLAKPPPRASDWVMDPTTAPLPEAARQLGEYFAGKRRQFDLPLRFSGTDGSLTGFGGGLPRKEWLLAH
jgi:methylated-DNA-[protein]-cysteine S-methyltransferase